GQLVEPTGKTVFHQDGRINISLLSNTDGQQSHIVQINPDGSFDSPNDLKTGQYLVEVLVPGYRLHSTQIDLQSSQKAHLTLEKLDMPGSSTIRYSESSQGVGSGKVNLTPPQM